MGRLAEADAAVQAPATHLVHGLKTSITWCCGSHSMARKTARHNRPALPWVGAARIAINPIHTRALISEALHVGNPHAGFTDRFCVEVGVVLILTQERCVTITRAPDCSPACVRGTCAAYNSCNCTGTNYTGTVCNTPGKLTGHRYITLQSALSS